MFPVCWNGNRKAVLPHMLPGRISSEKNLIFTVQWSTCSSCSQRNKHNRLLSPLQATFVDCMSYVITRMYMCDCVSATYSVVASQHTKYVPVAFWIHVHPSKYIFTHHKPRKKLGPKKKAKFDSNSELGEFWGLWWFWDFCQCFVNQQPELGGPASLVSPSPHQLQRKLHALVPLTPWFRARRIFRGDTRENKTAEISMFRTSCVCDKILPRPGKLTKSDWSGFTHTKLVDLSSSWC